MIIGRRKILLAALVVVLGAAIFMNWYFGSSGTKTVGVDEKSVSKNLGDAQYVSGTVAEPAAVSTDDEDYFVTLKLERREMRDELLEELGKLGSGERESATLQVTESIKMENDIENLVKAKGVDDCVATVNADNVTVIVKCEELDDVLLLQIKEIANKQTGIDFENITVVNVK